MGELEPSAVTAKLTLALDACGVRNADADHAVSHLGQAIGLSALLRGTVAHAKQRRCYLPSDACARHGVSTESVYRMEPSEGVRNVAHEVASAAKGHLDSARAMASSRALALALTAVAAAWLTPRSRLYTKHAVSLIAYTGINVNVPEPVHHVFKRGEEHRVEHALPHGVDAVP